MFTCGALFCGIGGLCSGFEQAGFETKWATDLNEDAQELYQLNFPGPGRFIRKNIEELNLESLAKVDVIHGGFPCQSFSPAGNRKGFDDPRGQLFNVMMDKIEQSIKKPKILIFENSPFIKLGAAGKWFDHMKLRIQRAGYWFDDSNAFVIDARENCGLPQRRERLFMVATSQSDFDWNPFLGISKKKNIIPLLKLLDLDNEQEESLYLSDENKYGEMLVEQSKKLKRGQLMQLRRHFVRPQPVDMCPTLTANMGMGGHNVPFVMDNKGLRKLSIRECLRLQGFPASFKYPKEMPASRVYRLIGNAVSPKVSSLLASQIIDFLYEELEARGVENGEQLAV